MTSPPDLAANPESPDPDTGDDGVSTASVFGRRHILRVGAASWVMSPRRIVVTTVMVALVAVLFFVSICISEYPVDVSDVIRILRGDGSRVENIVILDSAVPRACIALLVGFGLALSGALTQLIARNPLATPDILGITAGASAAAVLAIAFGSTWGAWFNTIGIPASALIGGLATALAMYVLAWPGRKANTGVDPMRLILIGIGVTWMLQALTGYLLTRASIQDVGRAQVWLIGSVNQASWSTVWPALIAVVLGVTVVTLAAKPISALTLGTDLARGLGVNTSRVGTLVLVTAILVAALSVAAAGPIAFVALLAPQIAMRISASAVPTPALSGLFGSAMVLGGDILVRTVLPGGLPVGIVTAALGGPFLIYLLISMSRKASV